jgi:hypothetical protein
MIPVRHLHPEDSTVTLAICTHCGGTKFGAFVACPECRHVPATEHDIIYAIALSDHHFDAAKLDEIAQSIKGGQVVRLPQAQEEMLRPAAREYLEKHGAVIAMMQQAAGPQPDRREQRFEGRKRPQPHGNAPGFASPEQAGEFVPFHPSLPDITKLQPARAFQGGPYIIFFVKRGEVPCRGHGYPVANQLSVYDGRDRSPHSEAGSFRYLGERYHRQLLPVRFRQGRQPSQHGAW